MEYIHNQKRFLDLFFGFYFLYISFLFFPFAVFLVEIIHRYLPKVLDKPVHDACDQRALEAFLRDSGINVMGSAPAFLALADYRALFVKPVKGYGDARERRAAQFCANAADAHSLARFPENVENIIFKRAKLRDFFRIVFPHNITLMFAAKI